MYSMYGTKTSPKPPPETSPWHFFPTDTEHRIHQRSMNGLQQTFGSVACTWPGSEKNEATV